MTYFINRLKSYWLGLALFYTIIAYIPQFVNQYYLPKLSIILFFSITALIFLTLKLIRKKTLIFTISYSFFLLFALLFFQVITAFFSQAPFLSIFGYYKTEGLNLLYLGTVILLVLLTSSTSNFKKFFLFYFILAATTISSLLIINQHLIYKIERPVGLEGHPIWSASVIGISFLILLIFPVFNFLNKKNYFLLKTIMLIIHFVALIYLDSFQVFFCLIISLIIFIATKYYQFFKKIKKIYIFMALSGFIIIIYLALPYIIKKEEFSLFKRKQEILMVNKMFASEFLNLKDIKKIIFGRGQSTSSFYLLKYKDKKDPIDKEWLNNRAVIHNQFLEVLWSSGVIGFFIWTYILIKALKILIKNKDFYFLPIIFYFIIWQLLYITTPSLILIYFVLLYRILMKEKITQIKINFPKYISIIILLLIIVLSFIFYSSLVGEIYYSLYQQQKASKLQFWNEFFIQNNLDSVMAELTTCQRNLVTCNEPTLKNISSRILDFAEKKIFLNPLNPDNWNDLSSALFYHYYFNGKKDQKKFIQALKAVNYAFVLYPNNYYYFDTRGALYLDKKDYQLAEKDFLSLLDKNPNYLITIRHIIELYKQTGNKEKQKYYEDFLNKKNVPQCLQQ